MKTLRRIETSYNKGLIILNRNRLEKLNVYLSPKSIQELFASEYETEYDSNGKRIEEADNKKDSGFNLNEEDFNLNPNIERLFHQKDVEISNVTDEE